MNDKAINIEKALEELEELNTQLESGNLSLEESLALFEKGMLLTQKCQDALDLAETKLTDIMPKAKNNDSKDEQ